MNYKDFALKELTKSIRIKYFGRVWLQSFQTKKTNYDRIKVSEEGGSPCKPPSLPTQTDQL